uniref:Uncharacterized protein n=1 Tax=Arundo donax TaxID=35708 RepID=A0A0A9FVY6_ARUDO
MCISQIKLFCIHEGGGKKSCFFFQVHVSLE